MLKNFLNSRLALTQALKRPFFNRVAKKLFLWFGWPTLLCTLLFYFYCLCQPFFDLKIKYLLSISLGTNSLMFTNCLVFCDFRHVRSSILGHMFNVRTFNVRSVRSSVFYMMFLNLEQGAEMKGHEARHVRQNQK